MRNALGIDLGATDTKFVYLDEAGTLLSRGMFPTGDSTRPNWLMFLREQIADLSRKHPSDCIGLCAPGLGARDGRSIAWMRGRMGAIQDLDWTIFLQSSTPIPVLNDAHAALLGEAWNGAAVGARDVVMLTLGTGVGGAILNDGKLMRGRLGRAGHLGHITVDAEGNPDIVGTPGSLEDAIGDCTVEARSEGRFRTTRDLVAACSTGDAAATAVWARSIRALAASITSIINTIDPERIIIGGGIAAAGKSLFDPLQRNLDQMEWRPSGAAVTIVPATLGEYAGAIGAGRRALLPESFTVGSD